jgi:hypothetical protein
MILLFPIRSSANHGNSGASYAKLLCQDGLCGLSGFVPRPYFSHLRPFKNCLRMAFSRSWVLVPKMILSFRRIMASLRASISHVVGMGSDENVVRVDAPSSVTMMTGKHSFRNRPLDNLVSQTMGSEMFSMYLETTVSPCSYSTLPIPATFSPFHTTPKSRLLFLGELDFWVERNNNLFRLFHSCIMNWFSGFRCSFTGDRDLMLHLYKEASSG